MSIFSNLFGVSETENQSHSNVNWISLSHSDQLSEIIENSYHQPTIIFKHSTRCGISKMAFRQFEKEFELKDAVKTYFLDLLSYRALSNEVALRFNVPHESPQLLLIQNGNSIYNASHGAIDAKALDSKIGQK